MIIDLRIMKRNNVRIYRDKNHNHILGQLN